MVNILSRLYHKDYLDRRHPKFGDAMRNVQELLNCASMFDEVGTATATCFNQWPVLTEVISRRWTTCVLQNVSAQRMSHVFVLLKTPTCPCRDTRLRDFRRYVELSAYMDDIKTAGYRGKGVSVVITSLFLNALLTTKPIESYYIDLSCC